jgi:hypothetical protein
MAPRGKSGSRAAISADVAVTLRAHHGPGPAAAGHRIALALERLALAVEQPAQALRRARFPQRLWLATHDPTVYARRMDTVVGSAGGSRRGDLEETSPLPFEFEILARRKRVVRREGRSQDETAPFPLEFEVVARKSRQSQDETSPFLLEFRVVLPNGTEGFVRTARPPRRRGAPRPSLGGLPRLKWNGADASIELRRYAARIAAGESLPPYRGPMLANGELPQVRALPRQSAQRASHAAAAGDSQGLRRLAFTLLVMSALVVASVLLGNDAQLRQVGQSISGWFTGRDGSAERLRAIESRPLPSADSTPASQR